MGILSYLKISGAVIILVAISYLTWNYQHMEKVIEQQKQEIADQAKEIEFLKKAAKIDADLRGHKDEIKEVIATGDPARIKLLLDRLRALSTQAGD